MYSQRPGNDQKLKISTYPQSTALLVLVFLLASIPPLAFAAVPGWQQVMIDSCNSGVMQECLNAGVAFKTGQFRGKKASKDPEKAKIYINDAVKLAKKSCDKGNAQDCYTVGLMYFEGGMIPTDVPRGLNYLQRSCKSGYKQACDWLDSSGLRSMVQ